MNPAILSVAIGGWYPRGQARLIKQLHKTDTICDPLMWCNTYPAGSVSHDVTPYTFKPAAFREAQRRGYMLALWLDAAVYPKKRLSKLFAFLAERPVLAINNGGIAMGKWCSDAALEPLGITREESFNIQEVTTCVLGLNLATLAAQQFLDSWEQSSTTFAGDWANAKVIDKIKAEGLPYRTVGPVSDDERVYGHRHDQTAASAILHHMGVEGQPMANWLSYNPDADTMLINNGGHEVDDLL